MTRRSFLRACAAVPLAGIALRHPKTYLPSIEFWDYKQKAWISLGELKPIPASALKYAGPAHFTFTLRNNTDETIYHRFTD